MNPTTFGRRWLPTGEAALYLGISRDTLKRYSDRDDLLIEGVHWRRGPHSNSPRVWDIEACHLELTRLGMAQGRAKAGQA